MIFLKKIARSNIVKSIVCRAVFFYIKFVKFTSNISYDLPKSIDQINSNPAIYIIWHGRLLILSSYAPSKLKTFGLISDHIDGQLIAKLVSYVGVTTIFGSTNRKSTQALRQVIKVLKNENTLMMTPDGPRGPRMRINSAVVDIAQRTGVPIIPLTYSAKRCTILRSWDRFLFPSPFNKMVIKIGEPITIPKKSSKEQKIKLKNEVESALNKLTYEADIEVGLTPITKDDD